MQYYKEGFTTVWIDKNINNELRLLAMSMNTNIQTLVNNELADLVRKNRSAVNKYLSELKKGKVKP